MGNLRATRGRTPQVIVMDEFPYLLEQDPSLEATLQKVWDRYLREAPVLLVLIGSDISMMSALTHYDRPLYGRPTLEMVVEPFGPHETAEMLDLPAADAIDAQLVLGGFPQITQEWRAGTGMWDFLEGQISNPTSPLIVGGERILSAEFPEEARARQRCSRPSAPEREPSPRYSVARASTRRPCRGRLRCWSGRSAWCRPSARSRAGLRGRRTTRSQTPTFASGYAS